jgi:hypothetical protein
LIDNPKNYVTISYADLLLLLEGFKLKVLTWRFRSKMRAYFDDFLIKKEKVEITFSKNYLKGHIHEDGDVIPFAIHMDGKFY